MLIMQVDQSIIIITGLLQFNIDKVSVAHIVDIVDDPIQ